MIDNTQASTIIGSTAYSHDGDKIGKIGLVFLDDRTGQPAFATVNTGFFGSNESLVPINDATFDGERVTVPFSKDTVKDAPNVDVDHGHLEPSDEEQLYRHYQMNWSDHGDSNGVGDATGDGTEAGAGDYQSTGTPAVAGTDGGHDTSGTDSAGYDTSGRTTDDAMTRSEERLEVGTTTQEAGRARLRKYVTTETETVTVPVTKEHAVIEREPITDANADAAHEGPEISEEEHEVVLHEERPVVDKTVEAVERVRLGTETTTHDETVSEEVRTEHIEPEGDVDQRGSRS